jgi:hypothetical protein
MSVETFHHVKSVLQASFQALMDVPHVNLVLKDCFLLRGGNHRVQSVQQEGLLIKLLAQFVSNAQLDSFKSQRDKHFAQTVL